MTADDLQRMFRALAKRRPFRPFLIELKSGDRILVSHPEAVNRYGELFIHRAPDHTQRVFTGSSVCQLVDLPKIGNQ